MNDPTTTTHAEVFRRTLELIERHLEREHRTPVAPFLEPKALAQRFDTAIPTAGQSLDAVFEELDRVLDLTPRTTTRAFYNQLFAGRDSVAAAAEMLTALLNSSMYTYKAAGPHAIIERSLTRHMCDKLGLRTDDAPGEGVLCPGGSLANFAGMLMARDAIAPAARDEGLPTRLTMYTSALSHYSIPKNANMMGLGRERCRKVATDDRGRIDPAALDLAIRDDLASGFTPFMINATAGSTVLGAFDPLGDLADIASDHNLWLHVDGCLGCSAVLSSRHKHLLDGVHRADSVCWNAHKMMGVPLSCSAILTRETGRLHATFNEAATYLFQSDEDFYNMGTMSIQCGRRNDALKLFAAWKHHGDDGYDRRITHLFNLAKHAADIVRNDPDMTLSKEPESVTVCFELTGKGSDDLCQKLREDQRVVVGFAIVEGRRVVRLACVNADCTEADIDAFFEHIRQVAPSLAPADNTAHTPAGA